MQLKNFNWHLVASLEWLDEIRIWLRQKMFWNKIDYYEIELKNLNAETHSRFVKLTWLNVKMKYGYG